MRAWRPRCERMAQKLVGRNGAEFDDLVQEGWISVWRALEKGVQPSALIVERRMRAYVRWLGRRYPVAYEDMVSWDALVGTKHEPEAE